MKKLFLAITVITLSCCSNQNSIIQDELIKVWRLSEVISTDGDDPDFANTMKPIIEQLLLKKGFVLAFFPDNTYSMITGYDIEDGTWIFGNNNSISFGENRFDIERFEDKKSKHFLIGNLQFSDKEFNVKVRLTEEAKMLKDFTKDPFYATNNQWRKKPNDKESDEQIKDRLLNYIRHYAYILNASSERKDDVVSFSHSMGIIRVYRGGIGRVKKENIPEEWSNCFFDTESSIRAYELFSSYLNRGLYKGASTGEWVKDDYQILMTIYNEMENS